MITTLSGYFSAEKQESLIFLIVGIAVGLVLQAALTLTLDIFAEARGADYLKALQALPT